MAKREKPDKPNILIVWGDDIGWFNISAYNATAKRPARSDIWIAPACFRAAIAAEE